MTPAITVTQEQIHEFHQTQVQFMREVLDLDGVVVTDLSELSDFTYSGMPAGALDTSLPLPELVAKWDAWVIARVQEKYRVTLTTTVVNMIWLFNQIEVSRKALVH
jgi:hypothetical protein